MTGKTAHAQADDSCLNTIHSGGNIMLSYLYVALGGALGSVARYGLSGIIASRIGQTFPWGTIIVNLTGSFIIGFFNTLTLPEGRMAAPPDLRTFFMIGICGGYTTFSPLQSSDADRWPRRGMAQCGREHRAVRRPLPARSVARPPAGSFHQHLTLTAMQIPIEATLLRIFIGESDRWEHKPLYEAIVLKAREAGLAGATVLRGPMGFGKSSRLHTAKILRLSMDLPLVIEIVDSEEKIQAFLPALDAMMGGGLVTLEKVKVIDYRGRTPTN